MSLQVLAQDMASRGRGPDTMLVHMAPKEVYGLQALARAHGGSLSINPQTGLPEAGFLKNLLPTLIGAGLMFATGGAAGAAIIPGLSNAATIGLGLGGLQTLRTGSLAKGLMAGLGAYGGAGLMGSVAGAGTGAIEAGVPAATAPVGSVATPVSPVATAPVATAPVATAPVVPLGVSAPPAYLEGAVDPFGGFSAARVPVSATGGTTVDPFGGFPGGSAPAAITPQPAITSSTYSVDPAAFGRDYTNQMDIASDAATAARETAARNYTNQMDIASDLRAPKEAALREAGPMGRFTKGLGAIADKPSLLFNKENLKYGAAALAPALERKTAAQAPVDREQMQFAFDPGRLGTPTQVGGIGEYTFFRPSYTRLAAEGGLMDLYAEGGYTYDPQTMLYKQVEGGSIPTSGVRNIMTSNAANLDVANTHTYDPNTQAYTATPIARPEVQNNAAVSTEQPGGGPSDVGPGPGPGDSGPGGGMSNAGEGGGGPGSPGWAKGGISHLGDYSDGGRLLRGPGDGVSDSIPATIANKRPARLADGEFVVPARIVSELGNGSTEAGARKLYAMMDRIQKNRNKSVGKGKVAVNSRSEKLLPA